MDGGKRGKKFWEEQNGKTIYFFSVSSASPHLPSQHLVLAKKCVLIAQRTGELLEQCHRRVGDTAEAQSPPCGDKLGY